MGFICCYFTKENLLFQQCIGLDGRPCKYARAIHMPLTDDKLNFPLNFFHIFIIFTKTISSVYSLPLPGGSNVHPQTIF